MVYFVLVKTAHERENAAMISNLDAKHPFSIEALAMHQDIMLARPKDEWVAYLSMNAKDRAASNGRIDNWLSGIPPGQFPEIPGFHREQASVL